MGISTSLPAGMGSTSVFAALLSAGFDHRRPLLYLQSAVPEPGRNHGGHHAVTRQKTSAEWIKLLNAGMPCGPIYKIKRIVCRSPGATPGDGTTSALPGARRPHHSGPSGLVWRQTPATTELCSRVRRAQRGDLSLSYTGSRLLTCHNAAASGAAASPLLRLRRQGAPSNGRRPRLCRRRAPV
jgi:hypothetical protein